VAKCANFIEPGVMGLWRFVPSLNEQSPVLTRGRVKRVLDIQSLLMIVLFGARANMNDFEMLEVIAEAIGYGPLTKLSRYNINGGSHTEYITNDGFSWNPLEDDGDAFRLIIKFNLLLDASTCYYSHAMKENISSTGHIGSDGYGCILEVTRRAIVETVFKLLTQKT
jgi:hypothetical protein